VTGSPSGIASWQIVDVLGQALDGPGTNTVEHRGERELARLPQLGGAALELLADRADGGRDPLDWAPQPADVGNGQRRLAGLDRVWTLARHR
jgi:hypothetical protein